MLSRQTRRQATTLLAAAVCLGTLPAYAGLFGKESPQKHPARDFLPPVATINPKIEHEQLLQEAEDMEPVTLSAINTPVLQTTPAIKKLEGNLDKGRIISDELKTLMELQHQVEEEDLTRLWTATVEKNPVIRFSLEKISMPADLGTKHSSQFLRKSMSALVYGATMGASMFTGGSGGYQDMATMAVGNAAQNLITGKTKPSGVTLSATEEIQLAGLIDDLKMRVVTLYQGYRSTLQALSQSHQVTVKNNNLYSKALASNNDLAVMASGAAYYKALMKETELRQKAKLQKLLLERIAGEPAVADLQIALNFTDSETAVSNTQPFDETLIGPPLSAMESSIRLQAEPERATRPVPAGTKTTNPEVGPPEPSPDQPPALIPDKLKEVTP